MSVKKILIVEDEGIVVEEIRSRLGDLGYEIAGTASRGEVAIKLAESSHPDLVLMDVHLASEMNGIEAAKEIGDRFALPVVFLTAFADEDTMRRATATAPFGYVLKPFEERELHIAIEIALERHKHEAERERLVAELQHALSDVKRLQGIIPICMYCKQIRDDEGFWNQVEVYVSDHADVEFSHGICPSCGVDQGLAPADQS